MGVHLDNRGANALSELVKLVLGNSRDVESAIQRVSAMPSGESRAVWERIHYLDQLEFLIAVFRCRPNHTSKIFQALGCVDVSGLKALIESLFFDDAGRRSHAIHEFRAVFHGSAIQQTLTQLVDDDSREVLSKFALYGRHTHLIEMLEQVFQREANDLRRQFGLTRAGDPPKIPAVTHTQGGPTESSAVPEARMNLRQLSVARYLASARIYSAFVPGGILLGAFVAATFSLLSLGPSWIGFLVGAIAHAAVTAVACGIVASSSDTEPDDAISRQINRRRMAEN